MNRILPALATLLTCLPCAVQAEWLTSQWDTMGTRAQVELWQEAQEGDAAIESVRAEFERLEQMLSPWIESSELAQVNALAAQSPVAISEEFIRLIKVSRHYNILTDGAFDITFAAAGHLYDYRDAIAPEQAELERALSQIGMQQLMLHPDNTVSFAEPGVRIDLGGIAKGYAIDRAASLLREAGIEHAWISLGGDSYVLGDRQGRLWHVGIQHPRDSNQVMLKVPVADLAVSTSGDYQRFFMEDGERIHHILDPANGLPADELASVTILADHSIDADALSTSVFVMGSEQGLALIESMPGVSAIIVRQNGELIYSSDLLPGD